MRCFSARRLKQAAKRRSIRSIRSIIGVYPCSNCSPKRRLFPWGSLWSSPIVRGEPQPARLTMWDNSEWCHQLLIVATNCLLGSAKSARTQCPLSSGSCSCWERLLPSYGRWMRRLASKTFCSRSMWKTIGRILVVPSLRFPPEPAARR